MEPSANKRQRIVTDPIWARVELVNGIIERNDEVQHASRRIGEILERASRDLQELFIEEDSEKPGTFKDRIPHDKGRVLHGLDLIRQARNDLHDSLLLKIVTKEQH
jgi:hypothetical protein